MKDARANSPRKTILAALGLFVFLTGPAPDAAADAYLQAEVLSLTTNAVSPAGFVLDELTPRAGLYLLPYYLRVNFPSQNFTSWGIQLYTNNAPDRSWAPADGVYNGLRGTNDPQTRVPLYWQVYDAPQPVTCAAGGLAFYDDAVCGHTLNLWGLVKDRNDPDMANWQEFSTLQRRTLANYRNLGDFPSANRAYRNPPAYLYLGIDVRGITQTDHFNTVLTLDLYNLGADLSTGGYATPNPFTPATGQRANFNFFLRDINSRFEIRIFTLRGRCIRTINNSREWDGRTDAGHPAEGGLYIYQITAEGRRVSGTVVLIR